MITLQSLTTEQETKILGLKSAHFRMDRADRLRDAVVQCIEDYRLRSKLGKPFEARGVIVTGNTRVGKSQEIQRVLEEVNNLALPMKNGTQARMVHCLLSGRGTWKDLGNRTIAATGYRKKSGETQDAVWQRVTTVAENTGVIGIHYDECQHVFVKGSRNSAATNASILDSFKTLLKDRGHPLILILSGVPELAEFVNTEPQLAHLLRPVHFDDIVLDRSSDKDEVTALLFEYADLAEVSMDELMTEDFLGRLVFACCNRWGLVIELICDALERCIRADENHCGLHRFNEALCDRTGLSPSYTPFVVPDYVSAFDPAQLEQLRL